MNNPLVSVIIPVYDVEEHLGECIKSVLGQTYNNIEIIIINDGSPGDTKSVLSEFKDKRIQYIDLKQNSGLFRARIAGMKKSQGEYITHLDGDDFIMQDYIQRLVFRASDTKADIVLGEFINYDKKSGNKRIINPVKSIDFNEVVKGDMEPFAKLIAKDSFFWEVCGKLYKRDLVTKALKHLDKINEHVVMAEDLLFNFHFFYFCKALARAEFSFYIYANNNESATSTTVSVSKREKSLNDLICVFFEIKKFLEKQGVYSDFAKQYSLIRNQQAAKQYIEIHNRHSGRDKDRLVKLVNRLVFDRKTFQAAVLTQEYSDTEDVYELIRKLHSMNSIKVSAKKLLSNIKRKIKTLF